jgi:hypothetical protein
LTKLPKTIAAEDVAGKYLPKVAGQAVAILVPLWNVRWKYRDEGHPKGFLDYRRRLENLASYIGFSIRESGAASSYDCRSDNMKLHLILMGQKVQDICSEVRAYLQVLRLPDGSTMVVFDRDSPEPHEIGTSGEIQPLEELFSRNWREVT